MIIIMMIITKTKVIMITITIYIEETNPGICIKRFNSHLSIKIIIILKNPNNIELFQLP